MQKHQRLEEDFKIALSDVILHEIKNPNIDGIISVTSVKITPDQKYANAYVSVFNADKEKVIISLQKSVGYIKNEVSKKVKMRNIPNITFQIDNSMEYGAKMDKLIDNLKK